ncbi:ATP-grasp domain-containing protein [Pseudomonas orientalis]|uniref:ATP-grasp domain-containing protein n=1 Tax=Pseudomonas orientalis TaxID=76758 RepID=A0A1H2HBR7_9PSED|nr:ATP-grasp domain-containing protein [Pseudomonas orientalis]KRP61048.1 hypothetical protein TU82_24555 [Pseudomonas orientalis]SDU29285.1 ATP-grasp domain-containing protein [Pseudomonas orientalis]
MIKTVIFVTQTYLQWLSAEAMQDVKSSGIRLVLLVNAGEPILKSLDGFFDDIVPLTGRLGTNIRPVLPYEDILTVVQEEVRTAGAPEAVRLFCQEEGHVLDAAAVRQALGIPGDRPELVSGFRDKILMKERVRTAGIRIPLHVVLDLHLAVIDPAEYYLALKREMGAKLVIKPVDAAGSLNVFVVENVGDFVAAMEAIRLFENEFKYEVDEFIEGDMFQCDSFVQNGQIKFCGTFELGCTNFDFVQGRPLTGYPTLDPDVLKTLEDYNARVIKALGMQNGCTHHEFFVNPATGQPTFLEIACRSPGGVGVYFHIMNKNFNLIDAYLYQNTLPDRLGEIRVTQANNVVAALLPVGHGRIVSLNEPDVVSRYDIRWMVERGAVVNANTIADAAGILTLYNDNHDELRSDFERLQQYVPVTCQPEH